MADEEKTETAEVNADAEDSKEEPASSLKEEEIDYEAIAQAEATRAEKAENAVAKLAFKGRKKKRAGEVDDEPEPEDEEEQPLTRKDLQAFTTNIRSTVLRETQAEQIRSIAKSLSSTDAEYRAILATHANRSFPEDLSIQDQLEESKAIVNRKRNAAVTKELARAVAAKDTVTADAASAQRDGMEQVKRTDLPKDSILKGYKHEGGSIYSKKLSSGATMFVNAKPRPGEKKTWVA